MQHIRMAFFSYNSEHISKKQLPLLELIYEVTFIFPLFFYCSQACELYDLWVINRLFEIVTGRTTVITVNVFIKYLLSSVSIAIFKCLSYFSTQQTFNCSKSTVKTVENGVKYVQS